MTTDLIPRKARRFLYGLTVVLQLALVAGILTPLGDDVSSYVEDWVQFLAALSALGSGGVALAHSRPPVT
jgi:hypothetical protein